MANNTNTPANGAEKVNENKTAKANTNTPAKENTKVVAIPIDPLNKKNDEVKVTINGKETKIKRGVQQTVSKDVYERLVIAGYIIEG